MSPAGARAVIPYGIQELFRTARPAERPPGSRAIFTSNPLRALDWLLSVWTERIVPEVAGAELHIFSGAETYGGVGDAKATAMNAVLDRARTLGNRGVVVRAPVPKADLVAELARDRRVDAVSGWSGLDQPDRGSLLGAMAVVDARSLIRFMRESPSDRGRSCDRRIPRLQDRSASRYAT